MDERAYARSSVLIPPETRILDVLVCGAGMVGSWTVAALGRMVNHVRVVDPDTVDLENVGVQLYTPVDVGRSKVASVQRYCSGLPVSVHEARMEEGLGLNTEVVVSAVDSMSGREWLAKECVKASVPLFVDVRVMGELVCILTWTDESSFAEYLTTIMPDDAVEEAPCGSEGTIYSGMFAASRVAAVINNWSRGIPVKAKEVWHVGLMELVDGHMEGGEHDDEKRWEQIHTYLREEHEEGRHEGSIRYVSCPSCVEAQDGPQGHTRDYTREQVEQEVRASEGDPLEGTDWRDRQADDPDAS